MSMAKRKAEILSQLVSRNESGRVIRTDNPALEITRPARRKGGWAALLIKRKSSSEALAETLDELRGEKL